MTVEGIERNVNWLYHRWRHWNKCYMIILQMNTLK